MVSDSENSLPPSLAVPPNLLAEPTLFPGQCRAIARHAQRRCTNKAVAGGIYCHCHGGRVGAPAVHGLYASVLSKEEQELYLELASRPITERTHDEATLLTTRIVSFLKRVEEGKFEITPSILDKFSAVLARLAAIKEKDVQLQRETLARDRGDTGTPTINIAVIWDPGVASGIVPPENGQPRLLPKAPKPNLLGDGRDTGDSPSPAEDQGDGESRDAP